MIMVGSKSVAAQSIETLKGPIAPDRLQAGGDPEDIAVNTATNKINILNPGNGTVTVMSNTPRVSSRHYDDGHGCFNT